MDIDIDFENRDRALELFKHIPAGRIDEGKLVRHNTGVYFHQVPMNAVSGTCSVPFNEAESLGYFKIDFLNVSLYKNVKDNDHLERLLKTEPIWELLEDQSFSDLLFQLHGHNDILKKMKPASIEQLAAVLSMIRPAKRYLIGKDWKTIFDEVWVKPTDGEYYWKKSHAIAYAVAITVQMNLICEQLEN